ncbi:cytochrome P450 family protein [Amycolatopsis sp. H20-H5]|uniref:cytochrome P450 family protein n=1 Tax=Amycolatopsis sp. H20-H5 TaxID=3046309 RepID=UPI002DB686EA|nr:cytochrome P450 [Amycolatopsis sp. H20-H5]MEC3978356.1 cytochrome P450 [Amycolatopsis sp. H20-H5]
MGRPDQLTELGEDFAQRSHELEALLREQGPVRPARLPRGLRVWVVSRYAEARALLTDTRLSKDSGQVARLFTQVSATGVQGGFAQSLGTHMLNMDPPDHTRVRKLINKAFTARSVARMRSRIEEITAQLLDELGTGDEVDLLAGFAGPLPITVICELLGVREEDRHEFAVWSGVLVSSAPATEVQESARLMYAYLSGLIAEKRENPGENLLSDLVHATDEGDSLSEAELVSMAFLLLVAGHETTVNLIGNAVLALLREPAQLAALRADPALLPGAVEEFLRYDGPVHLATLRFTTEPLEVGDVTIPVGQFVLISLLGANRDPARFPDPDRLDVTRPASGHLAFGHGIHHCVGAPLARLEAEIALGALITRFPALTLTADPETLRWRASTLMHGLETLPVRLRCP